MKTLRMNRSFALSLQIVIGFIGAAVLTFMLWEPHLEGRNAHATTFAIYFKDPFLAYVYAGSIPFFVALYLAFGLFGNVRRNGGFSSATLAALRAIKRCGQLLFIFVLGGAGFILLRGDPDDRPPGMFMSLLAAMVACALVAGTTRFARNIRGALGRTEGRE